MRHARTVEKNSTLAKPAVKRLARRAGIKRMSGETFDTVRDQLDVFITKIVKDCMLYMNHGRRKTVTSGDVLCALAHNGRKMYTCI